MAEPRRRNRLHHLTRLARSAAFSIHSRPSAPAADFLARMPRPAVGFTSPEFLYLFLPAVLVGTFVAMLVPARGGCAPDERSARE